MHSMLRKSKEINPVVGIVTVFYSIEEIEFDMSPIFCLHLNVALVAFTNRFLVFNYLFFGSVDLSQRNRKVVLNERWQCFGSW